MLQENRKKWDKLGYPINIEEDLIVRYDYKSF